jgi:signal transduction histidine kinase
VTGLRRALLGLAAAGLAAGIVAGALVSASEHDTEKATDLVFGLAIGWSFIGTGLFAWWRRPDNNFGALMSAVGFAWFLSALGAANAPEVFIVGAIFGALPFGLLIHLLLAFPGGRLEGRWAKWLAAFAYFETTVMQLAIVLVTDTAQGDPPGTTNPIRLIDSDPLSNALIGVQAVTSAIGLVGVAAFLWWRWHSAPRPQRRVLGPIYLFGALTLVLLAFTLTADVTGFADDAEAMVDYVSLATLTAIPFAFLAGLFRSRLARGGAVSRLMTRVGEGAGGERMRDLLAEALGDPSLELAYWLPERGVYVSQDGRELALPEDRRGVTQVERDGECVAAILHDPALDDERDLVRGAGAAVALALENERLDAELRARVEELRASRARLVEAGMSERRRLERDLHDGAQQRLVSMRLALGMARQQAEANPAATRKLVEGALEELDAALAELRELARGIHPGVLSDHGLEPALEALADRSPFRVDVSADAERLPQAVESAAYFMVAEALTNVAKYAQASHASVSVERRNGHAVIEVRDDGVGGADPKRGSGLSGLADRVAALDGRLSIESPAGAGTVLRAEIPCG